MSHYLALDLGAESGRGVLGTLDGTYLNLTEMHRFPTHTAFLPDGQHWDAPGLYNDLKQAIARTGRELNKGETIQGLGVDTWGVDYALLDHRGEILGLPYRYRDHRCDGIMDKVFQKIPKEEVFRQTGIQFMQINTLYQLVAARESGSPSLDAASRLLFMPDLLHYWLSGDQTCEYTIASTSQLYNSAQGEWALPLMEAVGIPTRLFMPVIQPGTTIGNLRRAIQDELGVGAIPIIAPGSHDTASAVAAAPASSPDYIYLSCGTWSLIGIELPKPNLSDLALTGNFTNEGGIGNTIRFLKNVMGLWLVQELRRSWSRRGENYDYSQLTSMAASAPAFECFIDPDDSAFLAPSDMFSAIAGYCSRTGQTIPPDPGTMVRACLEGLAFRYRENALKLETIAGHALPTLHMVGGGIQNRLLCQFAADATGKHVVAGPVEATAAGNILVQAMATGEVASLAQARRIVRQSFRLDEYDPHCTNQWEQAYTRFEEITGRL